MNAHVSESIIWRGTRREEGEVLFTIREVIVSAIIAGLLVGGVLALWPWTRGRWRFLIAGGATVIGFAAWNFVLSGANATALDVDAPVIKLSWQDVGSGVGAFCAVALTFGLGTDRNERAANIVGAATIAGVVAALWDVFVL